MVLPLWRASYCWCLLALKVVTVERDDDGRCWDPYICLHVELKWTHHLHSGRGDIVFFSKLLPLMAPIGITQKLARPDQTTILFIWGSTDVGTFGACWIWTSNPFVLPEDKLPPEVSDSSFLPSPHWEHMYARLGWACMCMGVFGRNSCLIRPTTIEGIWPF